LYESAALWSAHHFALDERAVLWLWSAHHLALDVCAILSLWWCFGNVLEALDITNWFLARHIWTVNS
jgi:hypothetical protein